MTKVQPGERKRQRASKVWIAMFVAKVIANHNLARHIKCGEEKPECLQCTTTGRKCEGYSLTVSLWNNRQTASVAKPSIIQAPSGNVFRTHELQILRFFLDKTIPQINTPFSQGLWSRSVPSIAQFEPSIKHALMALSELHERFTLNTKSQLELGRSALKHYNVAIQELLNPKKQRISPVIGLLCCLLFFAAELLQGKLASAIQLFRSGRRMIYELRRSIPQTIQSGSYYHLFQVLKESFKRLEYHVSTFFTEMHSELSFNDCYGLSNAIVTSSELVEEDFFPTRVAVFNSLPQALEELRRFSHDVVNRSYSHMSSGPVDKQRLANWCTAFESLKQTMPKPYTADDRSTILATEIWWRQVEFLLLAVSDAPNSGNPMWWDQYQIRLEEMLDYLEKIIRPEVANSEDSSSNETPLSPTFCMETGMITHLMTVIERCRDPYVRRRALALIKTYNRQEGLLRRDITIQCCQRRIELEEGDREVTCAADIPTEARIIGGSLQFHPNEPKIVVKYLVGSEWITDIVTWSAADDLERL